MKKVLSLILTLLLALSVLTVFAGAEDATTAAGADLEEPEEKYTYAVYGTPIVDGEIENEWNNAPINYVEHVEAEDGITPIAQARFRMMWDEDYVYVLVEVKDETMPLTYEEGCQWEHPTNLWYQRDGVSFAWTPDYSREMTASTTAPSFWYILRAFGSVANYNQVPQNIMVTEDPDAVSGDQNNFEVHPMDHRMYAISYEKNSEGNLCGYTIECKVNLKARYEAMKMDAGTKVGFDMYVNNNNYFLLSAQRDGLTTWTSEINSYKNNALKGTVEFADKSKVFDNTGLDWPNAAEETTEEETVPEVTTPAQSEDTSAEATTPVASVDTPAETTAAAAPAETTAAAPAGDVTTEASEPKTGKSGCGSFAAVGVAVIAILGCAFVAKKH